MRRNVYGLTLCAMLFALSFPPPAQQPKKVPRIGFLIVLCSAIPRAEAFRQGLRELGHVEGRTLPSSTDMGRGNRSVS